MRNNPTLLLPLRSGSESNTTRKTNHPVWTSIQSTAGIHLNNHRNLSKDRDHFNLKLSVIAGILGKETLKDMGFEKRNDFILKQFENMKLNT
jgi:hypothetical protein